MKESTLKIWEQVVVIPTYETGEMDKNPMFLEKRVYQGSSGRVYPYPVIDKIYDEKADKPYNIIFLENEYLQIQIMPELGGRIYRAIDKTNNYDFVYHNQVIKPALVGLTGPWISGGIEFNWPQHHRPNTFGPVEYRIDDSNEDCVTLWVSECDRMYGTKVTTGFTLYTGKAYIEITAKMFNPTSNPQTFLWWANPAVKVHDDTQSIFPPDVHAVMDHGKRAVSKFPIATGTYYKMDYSAGVDISRYKNIPVPTSYMAYYSDYDFVGGYDYKAQAGILHVADHHISPGKKQWTWGNGDFGQAWDRNLTDEDGPYIELMTGVFTDNQPDFTWLMPYEDKSFKQYFMPYKKVGEVKTANTQAVLGLSAENGTVSIKMYTTELFEDVHIVLKNNDAILLDTVIKTISPTEVFEQTVNTTAKENELTCIVTSSKGELLAKYKPVEADLKKIPEPAQPIGTPKSIDNTESLYLAGLHLEQYRHATYEPDAYYLEGLKREPENIRINNAYGNLLLQRGQFEQALAHFVLAKKTATRHSPTPYDCEVFYNLGKAQQLLGKADEAYDSYYKAVWSDAWQSSGYLKLAQISCQKKHYDQALEFARESMYTRYKNFKARNVLTIVQRHIGKCEQAKQIAMETLTFDTMDFVANYELYKLGIVNAAEVTHLLRKSPHNYISLAENYAELGFYADATEILYLYLQAVEENGQVYAMVYYYIGYYLSQQTDNNCSEVYKKAALADSAYCFPNTLSDYIVLQKAITINPLDAKAHYYLGCFLYDRKRHSKACSMWEKSVEIDNSFPTAHRNLALYYANKKGDYCKARKELEAAFSLNQNDARIFYELCELYKKINMPLEEQFINMSNHLNLVMERDDLTVEYISVLNSIHKHEEALELLMTRKFHPWEGGEGKVPTQHIEARIALANLCIESNNIKAAIEHLEQAKIYHHNFGEGKLYGAQENNIYYTLGKAYQQIDKEKAKLCFEKASQGLSEPEGAMYYNDQPPHMIYYQGLALRELGRDSEAHSRFNKLVDYGEKHLFDEQVMDFFAVSLPDFLVFENDLNEKNKIHCFYMMGLGYKGLGNTEKAKKYLKAALALSPNHYGALAHSRDL